MFVFSISIYLTSSSSSESIFYNYSFIEFVFYVYFYDVSNDIFFYLLLCYLFLEFIKLLFYLWQFLIGLMYFYKSLNFFVIYARREFNFVHLLVNLVRQCNFILNHIKCYLWYVFEILKYFIYIISIWFYLTLLKQNN